MTGIDKTVNRALNLVGGVADSVISAGTSVVEKVVARASSGGKPVTVTIARPRSEVEQVWRDAATLSRILGTVADVAVTAPNQYRWTVHVAGGHDVAWESKLIDRYLGSAFPRRPVAGTDEAQSFGYRCFFGMHQWLWAPK